MTQRFATAQNKLLDFILWSIHEYRILSAHFIEGSKYSNLCQINQKMLEIFLQDLKSYTTLCNDLDQNLAKSSESFQILIQELRNFSISFSELINNEVNTVESLAKCFAAEHNIDINSFVWIEDETCSNEVGLLRFSNKQRLSMESFNYNGVCSKSTCGEFFHFSSISFDLGDKVSALYSMFDKISSRQLMRASVSKNLLITAILRFSTRQYPL